jgi:hypothetical protein
VTVRRRRVETCFVKSNMARPPEVECEVRRCCRVDRVTRG